MRKLMYTLGVLSWIAILGVVILAWPRQIDVTHDLEIKVVPEAGDRQTVTITWTPPQDHRSAIENAPSRFTRVTENASAREIDVSAFYSYSPFDAIWPKDDFGVLLSLEKGPWKIYSRDNHGDRVLISEIGTGK